MKKQLSLIAIICCLGQLLYAQLPEEKLLYPNGIENNPIKHSQEESYVDSLLKPVSLSQKNRVYSYISNPSYMLFPAADSNNKHVGVLIFPGGGLVDNWVDKEGTDLALWLSAKGINCMVVKYRTNARDENRKYIIPMDTYKKAVCLDAKTSFKKFEELSESIDVDKDKIGVIGFSAGGWIIEKWLIQSIEEEEKWEPGFAGLVYFGNGLKFVKKLKKHYDELPPFFMATARDDKKLPLHRIMPYLTKLILQVNKSELHIYSKGDHGFGLAYDNGHSVELWKENYYRWLLDICNK